LPSFVTSSSVATRSPDRGGGDSTSRFFRFWQLDFFFLAPSRLYLSGFRRTRKPVMTIVP
jgi:hypothetical protein